MRAWELNENNDPPTKPVTLRALHKLKLEAKAKAEKYRERLAFMPKIYGSTDVQRERLELERLKLELAQLKAEISATNAETANKSAMALHRSAQSGIDATEKNDQKLTKLAKQGLGRKLKV